MATTSASDPAVLRVREVLAAKLRKGSIVYVPCSTDPRGGRWVRLTQREKWNSTRVKLHFEAAGEGLVTAQFGHEHVTMTEVMFSLNRPVLVLG